jgi:hypothetical protein
MSYSGRHRCPTYLDLQQCVPPIGGRCAATETVQHGFKGGHIGGDMKAREYG